MFPVTPPANTLHLVGDQFDLAKNEANVPDGCLASSCEPHQSNDRMDLRRMIFIDGL